MLVEHGSLINQKLKGNKYRINIKKNREVESLMRTILDFLGF